MNIKKVKGKIIDVKDLSKTAKEIKISISDELDFIAGSFINVFMDIEAESVRRAYSISSYDNKNKTLCISVRNVINGKMSHVFWNDNLIGKEIEIMGPLGLNTVDKMSHKIKYLFGFGIGAGVVKAMTEYLLNDNETEKIVIVTGSKNDNDIIHKKYFDEISKSSLKTSVSYVVSSNVKKTNNKTGYIQDNISEFNFDNSDVYVCGQTVACDALIEKIKNTNPKDCAYLIEDFH